MFNIQVRMEDHREAIDWLDRVGVEFMDEDMDDISAMVEQVVSHEL